MKFSENKTTGEITLKMSKSEVETFLFENDKLKNNLLTKSVPSLLVFSFQLLMNF